MLNGGKGVDGRAPKKMHQCNICFKEFPRPSALKTHMNVHNNARPYTCGFPNCPKTFSVRSNARRHYRTHGERPPQRGSPVQFQAGFKFAELIDAPEQPLPPPLSLSQAPFRVRWVPPNATALTKVTHPAKRHERKWNSPGNADDSHEQQMQAPMFLYDPFSAAEPSIDDIRDIHSSSRTYPSE